MDTIAKKWNKNGSSCLKFSRILHLIGGGGGGIDKCNFEIYTLLVPKEKDSKFPFLKKSYSHYQTFFEIFFRFFWGVALARKMNISLKMCFIWEMWKIRLKWIEMKLLDAKFCTKKVGLNLLKAHFLWNCDFSKKSFLNIFEKIDKKTQLRLIFDHSGREAFLL